MVDTAPAHRARLQRGPLGRRQTEPWRLELRGLGSFPGAADSHSIDPAYGAIVTRRAYAGLTLGVVMFLSLTGFIVVMGMLTGESWCEDRWPWWGPPEDPGSTCTGHSWARKHPGDYPWTMPR